MKLFPLKTALISLRRNKTRAILTILGIVIGIMAVITVMSAGQGLQGFITGQISKFGSNLVVVEIKIPNTSHVSPQNVGGMAYGISITTLTLADAEAIKKLPNIKNNYPILMGQQVVSYGEENKQVMLWGTTESFNEIDTTGVAQGRFFTEEDDKSLANVSLIGKTIQDKFFGGEDPLNKMIKIGRQKFIVIGVMNKRGSIMFFDLDNMIYLPIRTLQKKIMGIDHIIEIENQVYDNDIADQTAEEITQLMRQRHNIADPNKDDFSVMTMTQALDIFNTVFGAINLLLIAIAGISLVVGGVGIMNIMYVSVSERTYEIGLRKSFGATNRNILWQFLWEAIIITLLGAIIGLILGIGLSFLIAVVATAQGIGLSFVINVNSIFLAGAFSFTLGLTFGVFPAVSAARLDPVEALRAQK
ncbi:MAG: hypothetical protein A3J65_02780 [Candidatus Buchananbacteria bacterium RIFCSPHIGHO2_02_FULL_45_11b]|uniref:Multidrug ABC transporter substrate-binding protein n=4 Tax=Candidatus Buchananiibacteriota TaxID=1817903 RepID=A0A1G1YPM6_9BACT|nr:MAG: hypothetical protein A2663_02390 [Candidatus Buchananbacteria bacterium RIFCSPHIGHO2_01_FULL_46_12]OGY49817.1 MAG: hypothetical protein A3J65_02780 [Candidatus Buchananbacteria bacterium RIFCSPHIGHO2_02_FULL_45_11b]OGY54219.1 MAG: hypothetical protein A3B15_00605 [Candidatus Buchananbacteria bacterium RIFCSPLOWO2_01_FULL_45_31]